MRWSHVLAVVGGLLLAATVSAQVAPDLRPPASAGFVHLQAPVRRQHPVVRSLEAWWRVLPGRAGGPTWYDLMGEHPGTLANMTTAVTSGWSATSRPGGDGDLRFDGVNDAIQVTGLLGSPAAITVSAWVYLQTAGTNGSEVISLGDVVSVRLDQTSTGLACAYYIGGSVWNQTIFAAFYAGTGWHHVAYVVNPAGSSQVVYVDGLPVASTTFSNAIVYTGLGANTFLGQHGNAEAGFVWVGHLDDARVWQRALSASEVAQVYRESQAEDPALLVRLFPVAIPPPSTASRALFFPFFGPDGDRH
jgi:hypothetical protein